MCPANSASRRAHGVLPMPMREGAVTDSVCERANPGCAGGRGFWAWPLAPAVLSGETFARARANGLPPASPAAACTSPAMRECARGQQCALLRRCRLAHSATDSGGAEQAFFDSSNPTHYEDTLPSSYLSRFRCLCSRIGTCMRAGPYWLVTRAHAFTLQQVHPRPALSAPHSGTCTDG